MPFYGREFELQKINQLIKTDRQENILLYGRRRIGKTVLINQALNRFDGKSLYFYCLNTTKEENLASLFEIIRKKFGSFLSFSSFEDILLFLFMEAKKEKIIVAFDEFPYLLNAYPGVDSLFQKYIDQFEEVPLKFIFVGSYMNIMYQLDSHDAPLNGRISAKLLLKNLNYQEASCFYPHKTANEKVMFYSVFGGFPFFCRNLDESKNLDENIQAILLDSASTEINELESQLFSELRKDSGANEVFSIIAKGKHRFSDILQASQMHSSSKLDSVLKNLVNLDLLVRVVPINDESNRKKTFYYIQDNFIDFYYRYIFRNRSFLNNSLPSTFFDAYIKEDLYKEFIPHKFEDIIRDYLILENRKGKINPPFLKIGKFWYDDPIHKRNGEFDVVTQDKNGYRFIECKFTRNPLDETVYQEEKEAIDKLGISDYRLGFASISGFQLKKREKDTLFISADDLYE